MSSFEPNKGPCSGGTLLSIHGSDLDVGASVKVTVIGTACILKDRFVDLHHLLFIVFFYFQGIVKTG